MVDIVQLRQTTTRSSGRRPAFHCSYRTKTFAGWFCLSEFSWNLDSPSAEEQACYMMRGTERSYWASQGSYYLRDSRGDIGAAEDDWSFVFWVLFLTSRRA